MSSILNMVEALTTETTATTATEKPAKRVSIALPTLIATKRTECAGIVSNMVLDHISDRVDFLVEKGGEVNDMRTTLNAFSGRAFDRLESAGFDFAPLMRKLGQHNDLKGADNFLANKTHAKVMNLINALAQDNAMLIGSQSIVTYTRYILESAIKNGGKLSNQGVWSTLSRRVQKPELEQIKSATYSPGTAGSQGSQVRDALYSLGFAQIKKGGTNDTMLLTQNGIDYLGILFNIE